jgi:glucose/arabinose dehydrogenase
MRLMVVVGFAVPLAVSVARADTLSSSGSPSPADTFVVDENFVTGTGDTTDFRWLPDGRLVIINKAGNVLVRPAGGGALVAAGSFAVDTASEKGLLGVAVDPAFATTRRLFFYYSAASGTDADKNRVVSRTLGADSMLDPGETPLLGGLRGPANHDGGALEIGPDGFLYVGVGDSGCNSGTPAEPPYTPSNFYPTCLADDPMNNGAANGKILRIALDGSVPPTNPLVGATNVTACGGSCGTAIAPGVLGSPRTAIFAWGFRNPWRIWADARTGLVWVGDVGEISYEEVTILQAGRHHGWPWREGGKGHPVTKCHDVRVGTGPAGVPIMDGDCVDPVYFCRSADPSTDSSLDPLCESITGGQIIDTCTWPAPFRGRYFFADNATANLWTLTPNATRNGVVGGREDFATMSGAPVSLHTGNDGALYIAIYPGRIARIAPASPLPCTGGCLTDGECDDDEVCTVDACNPLASLCTHVPIPGCGTTTTTTTLPAPCANLTAFARLECEIEAARDEALCGTGTSDPALAQAEDRRLERAALLVGRAETSPRLKRASRLLAKVDRVLTAISRRALRALRRTVIDGACQALVDERIARLRALLTDLRGAATRPGR